MRNSASGHSSLLWLTIAIALALVLPVLMMDGMFMDGMMYTAVGHNMALGKGTFWYPYYQDNFHHLDTYHENPPLAYYFLSLFFRLFGSSIFVERFYILLTFLLTGYLIYRAWLLLFPKYKAAAWFPILLWAIIPTVFWSYTHNMMENTMVIFILLAVMSQIVAMREEKKPWFWLFLSALFIILAFLVKGPTALYPLAGIFVYWLCWRSFSFGRMLLLSSFVTVIVAGFLLLIFTHPHTELSMHNYLFERTLNRINKIPIVTSRFWIVGNWLQQLILPGLIVSVIYFINRSKGRLNSPQGELRNMAFLFVLGLCGVLPLMLTLVQRPFYLVSVFPLFALALAIPVAPAMYRFSLRLTERAKLGWWLRGIALFIFAATLAATLALAGKPKRSKSTLADVELIAERVGKEAEISASKTVGNDESLRAYLVRLHQIQLHNAFVRNNHFEEYHLVYQGDENIPYGYEKVELGLERYQLYQRK